VKSLVSDAQDQARQVQALLWRVQQLQGKAASDRGFGRQEIVSGGISLALPGLSSAPGPHELIARTPATVLAQAARRAEEGESKTSQAISDRLVTFDSVDALREKHRQLLRLVRVLAEQRVKDVRVAAGGGSGGGGGTGPSSLLDGDAGVVAQLDPRAQIVLRQAAQRLASLQAEREKQQQFMASLVQQRDMYRALAKSDARGVSESGEHGTAAGRQESDSVGGSSLHSLVGGKDAAQWKREAETVR